MINVLPQSWSFALFLLDNASKFDFHLDPETYFCSLRLKSLPEEDTVKMQAGSAETHLLYVDLFSQILVIPCFSSSGH